MYKLNFEYYGAVFVVPSVIVEKYIKMASFCAMKSLLWILKNQSSNYSVEEIAKAIGSSAADTKEALDYWVNEGILLTENSETAFSPLKSDTEFGKIESKEEHENNVKDKKTAPKVEISRPTMEQITARMSEDKSISGLFNQAQKMLGRTIGFDLQSSLLMMIDTFDLPIEIIIDLLQYCVDMGKTGNAFILSVARDWYEKEVITPELVQIYVTQHNRAQKLFEDFRQLTGITSPKATPKQTELLIQWSEMGFSVEMIVMAYNEAVERTGKISYPYMNKIILNWNELGYKTPDDIKKGHEQFKKAQEQTKKIKQSYDIEKAINKAENGEIVYKKRKRGTG